MRPQMSTLRRLAANDPEVVEVWVGTHVCFDFAEALVGNTHVRKLFLDVTFEDWQRQRQLDGSWQVQQLDEGEGIRSWIKFCHAAQELSSLRELQIEITDEEPQTKHFQLVDLLLKYIRQVNNIHLECQFEPINNPAAAAEYGRMIARSIEKHPSLEWFRLEGFDCSHFESSLLLEALVTVPNLKSFDWDPRFEVHDQTEPYFPLPVECSNHLGRLLCKPSLESITLNSVDFTRIHVMAMTSSIHANPEAQPRELKLYDCRMPVDSVQPWLEAVARSTSLEYFSLRGTILSDFDAAIHANLLSPLASSTSLKKFDHSLHTPTWLQRAIDTNTKLNQAGRGYLRDGNRGPKCTAAGVNVLSEVINDLDCIFYHLRENPLLCDLGGRKVGGGVEQNATAKSLFHWLNPMWAMQLLSRGRDDSEHDD